ncbi:MAG: serine/threonine protein kinase [Actinobacteria bacterium]|nr:serine/threonine protein kinase [Actinomycetota bacterium]
MIEPNQLILGRYRVRERIGFGGMGEVWSAVDGEVGRDVAVKVLARHLAANVDARERFRREAQHAGSLDHDHVVSVYDAGTEGDLMLLVMELVEGGNLTARLRDGASPSVDEAVRIIREVLSGLSAAHEAGLVHRDVKPANVMFTSGGSVKLTDFGIARLAATETTRTAEVYGSTPYMAPELAYGLRGGTRSDVYAVGCVAYELLTGTSPFTGETPAVTIARHLQFTPPRLVGTRDGVSPELDAVVMRALAKDPADRYADACEMLDDLERAASGGDVAGATVALVRPLDRAERRRVAEDASTPLPLAPGPRQVDRRWLVLAAGVAAAAVILAVVVG